MCIKDFKLRKCLAKFRLSSHSLEIEKGRHCKPKIPQELCICKICKNGSLEDEYHFLMQCNQYHEERVCLFSSIIRYQPSILVDDAFTSFVSILNNEDENVIFSLCKFLQKAFKCRNAFIG